MNWLAIFGFHSHTRIEVGNGSRLDESLEHPIVFVERFWKWRDSLYVVAFRILDDSKTATEVVESCFRKACARPPKFASDGAFGSWLMRILLDHALRARAERRQAGIAMRPCVPTKPRATASKLEFTDQFWCLETTL
jgi:DNA-directed RNA polymerase specialized sigma24 family protein